MDCHFKHTTIPRIRVNVEYSWVCSPVLSMSWCSENPRYLVSAQSNNSNKKIFTIQTILKKLTKSESNSREEGSVPTIPFFISIIPKISYFICKLWNKKFNTRSSLENSFMFKRNTCCTSTDIENVHRGRVSTWREPFFYFMFNCIIVPWNKIGLRGIYDF